MMQAQFIQQRRGPTGAMTEDGQPKWFNSSVSFHKGNLQQIRSFVPEFERRAFALTQPGNERSRINERLDTIVRRPFGDDHSFIPVGVVSKGYALVPHLAVLDVAEKALDEAKIAPEEVKAELNITEYGERMALSLYLPEKFSFDPGDNHPLSMRLECFNSVDGSTRFRALMGWFRFVCSNGMVIGVTRSDVRRRHVGDLGLDDVQAVLTSGIQESEKEQQNFEQWRKKPITPNGLVPWVNKELKKGWGFKAAARVYHISRTGHDAEIVGPYKDNTPATIPVCMAKRVPGAPSECRNLYDVSQSLAWLAKERRDVQEQLAWREGIHDLLTPLVQ
ncbi:MAG: DUF932 domain-containing protein [Desulfobacterales bacterium]|nr:DUF932 domain-containing protein [Desulfobacterales bacterium]MDD4073117.1 DUF932 domain-containing protein [Desulfobacterales bacterium]MDD4392269.1 DUF932 domain-containing protein [Desulfobacterales bacterium]